LGRIKGTDIWIGLVTHLGVSLDEKNNWLPVETINALIISKNLDSDTYLSTLLAMLMTLGAEGWFRNGSGSKAISPPSSSMLS
jgi:hypothetical protein